jgi:hypothetical protein
MPDFYLLSCKECNKFHEQTGICLLGFTVPESLYEAELVAEKNGILAICRLVEKGELLANLVVKKTCDMLRRRDLNVQFL